MARVDPTLQDYVPFDPPKRRDFIPVDDMVAPSGVAPIQDNALYQFASGLAQINPELDQLLKQQTAEEDTRDTADATAKHMASPLAWGDAVREGIVPANYSPVFEKTWKEYDGQNQAEQAAAGAYHAFATDPSINTSTDPADVQAWLTQHLKPTIDSITDPSVRDGFLSKMGLFQGQFLQHAQAVQEQNSQANMATAAGTALQSTLGNYLTTLGPGKPADPAALSDALHDTLGMAAYAGINGQTRNQWITQAVANAALQRNDKSLLDVLAQPRTNFLDPNGPKIPGYALTSDGAAYVQKTRDQIDQQITAQNNADFMNQQRADAETKKTLGAQLAMQAYVTGKMPDMNDPNLKAYLKVDPAGLGGLFSIVEGKNKADRLTTPGQDGAFYQGLHTIDPTTSRIDYVTQQLKAGNFSGTPEAIKGAYDEASRIDNSGLTDNHWFSEMRGSLRAQAQAPAGMAMFKDASTLPRLEAHFNSLSVDWLTQNPSATPAQQSTAAAQILQDTLDWNQKVYGNSIAKPGQGADVVGKKDQGQQAPAPAAPAAPTPAPQPAPSPAPQAPAPQAPTPAPTAQPSAAEIRILQMTPEQLKANGLDPTQVKSRFALKYGQQLADHYAPPQGN